MPGRQSDSAAPQPRSVEIALTVGLELVFAVPLGPVNLESHALVNEQVLMTEPRYSRLGCDVMAGPLESQSRDRFEPRTAVIHHPTDSVAKSGWGAIAQESDFLRAQESQA